MRDEKVDLLRFLGLAMIILAHVGPPAWLDQLRNFDVPLMVLISGVAFALSYTKESYASYVWKRIKRLVFPVWIFLTLYFVVMTLCDRPIKAPQMQTMLSSYFLLAGIGYVWIIRVFLLVALVSPFIFRFNQGVGSHARYFAFLGLSLLFYETALVAVRPYFGSIIGATLESVMFYLVPFGIIFAMGVRLPMLLRNQVIVLAACAFLIFAISALLLVHVSGTFHPTQEFKYPPSVYYLSYAISVSCIAWLLADPIWRAISPQSLSVLRRFILFVARNSIWIYLWHIPFLDMPVSSFAAKYLLVFTGATLVVWLQVSLVSKILPGIKSERARANLKLVLTG